MRDALSLRSALTGVLASAGGTVALTSALAPLGDEVSVLNAGLLFLLLTLAVSSFWGWRVGALAAVLTNVALNFFFVEPLHRLSVSEPANIIGLVVFLIVSLVGGSLLSSARSSAAEALRRESETVALLKLSRAMIGQTSPTEALHAVCREVIEAFAAPGAGVLGTRDAAWMVTASAGWHAAERPADAEERAMAQTAVTSGQIVRVGNTGFGRARRVRIVPPAGSRAGDALQRGVVFVPLLIGDGVLGVLRIDGPVGLTVFSERPDRMLEAYSGEAALALERVELANAASHADALRRADEMKSALMASISHDLKTPLAGIKAAVSSLLDREVSWTEHDRTAFLETIDSQADRLNRTISDILDLNRIESGAVAPLRRSIKVADLLSDACERTAGVTRGRHVKAIAADDLYVVSDESLVAHALVNLVENAANYSRAGSDIRLVGRAAGEHVEIAVEDDGPGISQRDLPHVFERFYRGRDTEGRVKGSGLGLAIVSGFVALCGGSVRAESTDASTRFIVTLPAAG